MNQVPDGGTAVLRSQCRCPFCVVAGVNHAKRTAACSSHVDHLFWEVTTMDLIGKCMQCERGLRLGDTTWTLNVHH